MANKKSRKSAVIWEAVKAVPIFNIADLAGLEKNRHYLRILLSRWKKNNSLVSLKKGVYTSASYLDYLKRENRLNDYLEFVANTIYEPSYLSAEYVLAKYGVLTEAVQAITSVTSKKTKSFANYFGLFKYYHIKSDLFIGFSIKEKGGFFIAEASLAKALFDFLYFRQHILPDRKSISSLRLNLDNLRPRDWTELKKYIARAKSKKMKTIFNFLKK